MKGEIPGGKPGILPFVRHRNDVASEKVTPAAVAPILAAFRGRRLQRIAVQPLPYIEVVELLAPQQTGKGLALNAPHVRVGNISLPCSIEGIRFGNARIER